MYWINIARLTWLELWQNRAYKVLLILSLLAPCAAVIIASLFMVDIGKVYMDAIAGSTQLLAIFFIVFLVLQLLGRDIYERICYILLTPPVTRSDYYAGRFLGVLFAFLVLLLSLFISSAIGGLLYVEAKGVFYQSNYHWYMLAQSVFFCFFQYFSIIGVVFCIVSWSTGDAEAMLFTISLLLFAWIFPPVLQAMQNPEVAADTPNFVMVLLQGIYELLPHLQGSDISLNLSHGTVIGLEQTLLYVLEHILYGITFLLIGLIFFKKRDL